MIRSSVFANWLNKVRVLPSTQRLEDRGLIFLMITFQRDDFQIDQIIYERKIKNQLIYNQAKYHELELAQKWTDFRLLSTLDIKVS